MANNKIDRINKEIAKTREKITEYQNKLKGLEAPKRKTLKSCSLYALCVCPRRN